MLKLPIKRRWLQFSLRSFLVLITVVAVVLAIGINRARSRRAAIRAIDELGGTYGVQVMGPTWLRDWVGDDKYFYDAIQVSFGRGNDGYDPQRPFTDAELAGVIEHLNAFPSFSLLSLNCTDISDDGLRHLKRIRNLEHLRLNVTKVSDEGLGHLTTIRTLKKIELERTNVTDKGIAELRNSLPNCEIY